MKLVVSSKTDKFVNDNGEFVIPESTLNLQYYMLNDDSVENFVHKKLQGGFRCAIFSPTEVTQLQTSITVTPINNEKR